MVWERKRGWRFEESVGRMPSEWCVSERGVGVSKKVSVKCLRGGLPVSTPRAYKLPLFARVSAARKQRKSENAVNLCEIMRQ